MNPNRTEFFAAWIVALALIAVMGVHAFLPQAPPRLGPGVTDASQPRPALEREAPAEDFNLPLIDLGDPALPPPERRSLAEPDRGQALPADGRVFRRSGA